MTSAGAQAAVDNPYLRSIYRQANCIHPGSFFVRLDARCNQDCDFCNILEEGGSDFTSSPGYVKRMLRQIASLKPRDAVVNFTGGEPTLRKDLPMLVAYAKHVGVSRVVLQTNAIRFRQPSYLEAMMRAGLDDCLVSFHCHDEAVSDRMTRAPGTWARTHAGIENMLAAGLPLTLNLVISRDNLALVPDTMSYIAATFPAVTGVILSPLQPHGRILLRLDKLPTYAELKPVVRQAADRLLDAGIDFHLAHNENPLCWILDTFDIEPTPDVRRFIARRLDTRGCYGCHLAHTMDKDKVKAEGCSDCYMQDVCFGVWGRYHELFGDAELRPAPFPQGGRRLKRSVSTACAPPTEGAADPDAAAFRGVRIR